MSICKRCTGLTLAFITLSLLSNTSTAQVVAPEGPAPILFGQAEGIVNNPVTGAINSVAAHPVDADIVYVGAANGGIWKTTNALSANPNWINQTDSAQSQSIGDIVFDPEDLTGQTLVAGVGLFSSYRRQGGDRTGLLRTEDGGANWTPIGADLVGTNISKVAVSGNRILAAVNFATPFNCGLVGVYRSVDGGDNFSLQTVENSGLPNGVSTVITADPNDSDTLYTALVFADVCAEASNGIYKTADGGAQWSKVSDAAMDALITSDSGIIEIEFGQSGRVYTAISQFGELAGVFHSDNGGVAWTGMELPGSIESDFIGVHAGRQASLHFSFAVDPANDDIIYVGGDRQPRPGDGFPNSLGASDFSGRLFRGDASAAAGSQWTSLTHNGTASNSAPHADSRDMGFDANGNLLEGDDGGIYKRVSPQSTSGDWLSINGNLQITEGHDTAYDRISDIVITGNQDTGTSQQSSPLSPVWESLQNGDGGDVAVDTITRSAFNESLRYSSFQNLSFFNRRTFDSNNTILTLDVANLFVISGPDLQGQFKTPVALNRINPQRLVIGGFNSVYESFDQGDTLEEIGAGIRINYTDGNAVAYGAADNEEILYAGADNQLFVRTTAGGSLATAGDPVGTNIIGIALDTDLASNVFYIDDQNVYRTQDFGASTSILTGDLDIAATGRLRSIEFITNFGFDAIVVGTDRGLYVTTDNEGFDEWIRLDTNLPNVPVYELDYDFDSDLLTIGTLGRGAFTLPNALASVNRRPVAVDDSIDNVTQQSPVLILPTSNDFDLDGSVDDTTLSIESEPVNGSLVITDVQTGQVEYTSNIGFSGADSFTYTVSDNLGRVSNIATVTVDVLGQDSDGDSVDDSVDNCTLVANPSQFDADNDGFGNRCDPDTDNSCVVNFLDVSNFGAAFLSNDPLHDFNEDGVVNFLDFPTLTSLIFQPPGPSALFDCPAE